MNTLHLKYALEVEKTGSITQAADNLYMAQPNLSKAIKELEDQLGLAIFERTSKGVVPTVRGRQALRHAQSALEELEKMQGLSGSGDPRQRFSISIPRGSYIADGFTHFVSSLDTEREIDLKVKETNSVQAITNIVEGRFSLGIIRYPARNENYFLDFLAEKGLRHEPVWEFSYLLLMNARHPLAEREKIAQGDLEPFIEITHGDTTVPYVSERPVSGENASGRKRVLVFERSTQFDLLVHIETAYMWVSPIPEGLIRRYELVQRACHGSGQTYKDVLIYPERYQLTDLDKRFIDKLFEARNRVAFAAYK